MENFCQLRRPAMARHLTECCAKWRVEGYFQEWQARQATHTPLTPALTLPPIWEATPMGMDAGSLLAGHVPDRRKVPQYA